jgi:hypothetical protein
MKWKMTKILKEFREKCCNLHESAGRFKESAANCMTQLAVSRKVLQIE